MRGLIIYLDAFVGLNFLVDFSLLLGVNRLTGHPPGVRRAAAAAAVGGGYAGMSLVPGFTFLGNGLWRAVSLGIMSVTAFGLDRRAWKKGMLFILLSMALGGLALTLEGGGWGLPLCAGALAALCRMGFQTRGRRFSDVTVTYGARTVSLLALHDTGNALRDPLTGEAVLVLSPEIGMELGIDGQILQDPAGHLMPGIRLIPAQTVGGRGLLAAVRCDSVTIGGRQAGTLVAFGAEPFGNGEYQGLTGGDYG